jgi:innexin
MSDNKNKMILNDIIGQISSFLSHDNDDLVDKFHYRHTVVGLAIYLVLLTSKQYYGEPIVCVSSNIGQADFKKYIESFCWLQGTYRFDPSKKNFPNDDITRIRYYQWIVVLLITQCFLFVLPSTIWSFIYRINGFDLTYITRNVIQKAYLAYCSNENNWSKMQKTLQNVTDQLRISLLDSSRKKKQSNGRFSSLRSNSTFPLYIPYLLIKLAYVCITVFQFFLLSWVFGFNYFEFGFEEAHRILSGHGYNFENIYFPKRALCDIINHPAVMKDLNNHTVTCALPMNLFHEIFFSMLWIWLIFLFFITLASLIYWSAFLVRPFRKRHVQSLMSFQFHENDKPSTDFAPLYLGESGLRVHDEANFLLSSKGLKLDEQFELFFADVCSLDLILTVKLLAMNSNVMVAKDILTTLWYEYLGINTVQKLADKTHERRPLPDFYRQNISIRKLNELNDDYKNPSTSKESN